MHNHRILLLVPHPVVGAWGAGCSFSKCTYQGHQVWYVAFSAAEESVPNNFRPDILRTEIIEASKILGIPKSQIKILNFKVRFFPRDRQEILEEMIRLRTEIMPSVVIIPSSFDTHQDHRVIHEEGFRAFKRSSILGYEMPWNNKKTDLTYFEEISEDDISKKIASIASYKSQIFRNPNYEDFIRSLALQRGFQIGCRYAEAFEVIRWVAH
jgi:LmbE family N-acetylglucosaminyl deacetylase